MVLYLRRGLERGGVQPCSVQSIDSEVAVVYCDREPLGAVMRCQESLYWLLTIVMYYAHCEFRLEIYEEAYMFENRNDS
jgi:hypothetical protein